MPAPVIFKDLPATFPETDRYRKPSVVSSLIFHGFLILAVVVIPLLIPQALPKHELFITMLAPLPPPPPMRAPAVQPALRPRKIESVVRPVATAQTLVAPIAIPKVVLSIVEAPVAPASIGIAGSM